ncbi:MAG TPA: GYDIA family GHMP kinase [Saprospiraceae bacterium]|nr:GYDIA family GHMP kinase [Saprospiraceae bacterium]HPN69711.1 GYDIA family GHMP kinase [Saprospiraceae bacterium]
MAKFYAHGKLLLTGEYAVLDGSRCLALPTKQGQRMTIKATRSTDLEWKSYDHNGNEWFSSSISLYDFSATETTNEALSQKLKSILKGAVRLNCEFLDKWNAFKIETHLEFPLDWGLGSSSTLINLIAQWAEIEPLELYFKVENGSGYDVAAAGAKGPIIYWCTEDEISYTPIDFKPAYKDKLCFVHLNAKAKSEDEVKKYLSSVKDKKNFVKKIDEITEQVADVPSLDVFSNLMVEHESIVKHHTGFTPVKEKLFSDYPHALKSLGAWGGDFMLAIAPGGLGEAKEYFNKKGYQTVLPYQDIII